jgi:hypothetical protein
MAKRVGRMTVVLEESRMMLALYESREGRVGDEVGLERKVMMGKGDD